MRGKEKKKGRGKEKKKKKKMSKQLGIKLQKKSVRIFFLCAVVIFGLIRNTLFRVKQIYLLSFSCKILSMNK